VSDRWKQLSFNRLNGYIASILQAWGAAEGDVQEALQHIKDIYSNLPACIEELERTLS